jgi:hypothetical protein
MVVTAGYGGEGMSSGSKADVCFFVSAPRVDKSMVSLLPLALPPLRPQRRNKICAGGRARPRIMDCARFCAAQPLRQLYLIACQEAMLSEAAVHQKNPKTVSIYLRTYVG